jgi:hypothetical protein
MLKIWQYLDFNLLVRYIVLLYIIFIITYYLIIMLKLYSQFLAIDLFNNSFYLI